MNLAERVVITRDSLNLSQEELAKKIGVSQVTVWKIENTLTKRPRKIIELAKALEVSPEWLLTGEAQENKGDVDEKIMNQLFDLVEQVKIMRLQIARLEKLVEGE